MQSESLLIVAAEESSAAYAKRLLHILEKEKPNLKCFGVGNKAMEDMGFERLGKSEDMAVIGIVEVIKHYGLIRKVFYNLIDEAVKRKVKVVLLIDYPDFNMRLAKELKKRNIKVVYYISPTVWAWRQNRIHNIKKYIDKMLLIYPFEVDFYKKHEMKYEFVGHPLLDEMNTDLLDQDKIDTQKLKMGLEKKDTIIGLMPGSRRSEIKFHLSEQLEALKLLQKRIPNLYGALLLAPSLEKHEIQQYLTESPENFIILQDEPFKMLQAVDAVLVASGTATLVVALMQKPMVIMYKLNAVTAWLAKKIVKGVKYFGIVNLLYNQEVAPEMFQEKVNAKDLSDEMLKVLEPKNANEQIEKWKNIPNLLGKTGVAERVVRALDEYF
ncbi:MAG: lipid-A-disaccharide synthase [Bdellovibrionales bacterium]|nr:lipid-A-disaccharide synthase [Bdellovibrionales bacterium]